MHLFYRGSLRSKVPLNNKNEPEILAPSGSTSILLQSLLLGASKQNRKYFEVFNFFRGKITIKHTFIFIAYRVTHKELDSKDDLKLFYYDNSKVKLSHSALNIVFLWPLMLNIDYLNSFLLRGFQQ